jgi:hypothetical protein
MAHQHTVSIPEDPDECQPPLNSQFVNPSQFFPNGLDRRSRPTDEIRKRLRILDADWPHEQLFGFNRNHGYRRTRGPWLSFTAAPTAN